MGLMDVFAAVQANLADTLAGLSPPVKAPKFLVGKVSLAVEGDYPRIVWVPTTEAIVSADAQGGDGVRNPRPLWKRQCRVEAFVWEKDIPCAEALANHLIAACHATYGGAGGGYRVTGGSWNTDTVVQRGILYQLTIVFDIPYTRELDTMSLAIESFPLTQTIIPMAATG